MSPAAPGSCAGSSRSYQALRAGRPSPCRFQPTCSSYAVEALEAHGAGPWRLARACGASPAATPSAAGAGILSPCRAPLHRPRFPPPGPLTWLGASPMIESSPDV